MGAPDELTGAPREIAPPDLRPTRRRTPRATRWFGASLATVLTVGGLVLWRLQPTPPIPPPPAPSPVAMLGGLEALEEPSVPAIADLAPPGETPPDWIAEGRRLEAPVVTLPAMPESPALDDEPLPERPPEEFVPCVEGCGRLAVNTRPWSIVYVDGRLIGHTPQMSIRVGPGSHLLTMENDEYGIRESRRVTVVVDETTRLVITLTPGGVEPTRSAPEPPRPRELVLRSDPPGAVVSLVRREERRALCSTPCTVELVDAAVGGHLVFERDGYALEDRLLVLAEAGPTTVEIALVPLAEARVVTATPSRTEIQRALGPPAIEASRCGTLEGRIVTVHVELEGATGALRTVDARGEASDTMLACIEAAFLDVSVTPFAQELFTVDYPVRI